MAKKRADKSNKKDQDNFFSAIFFIVAALISLRFIGSFLPEKRLWGLNHAGYLDGLVLLYIVFLILTLILYFRGKRKPGIIPNRLIESPATVYKTLVPFFVVIASGAAFYFLSVSAHFMGDGYQLITWLFETMGEPKASSYGEMRVHQFVYKILGGGERADAYYSFKYISIGSGIIFVSSLLYYSGRLFRSYFSRSAFILINVLSAGTVLFYGYVELYSIQTACLYLFFLSSLAAIVEKKKSPVPIIIFAIAGFLHKISLIYVPTLAIYLFIILANDEFIKKVMVHFRHFMLVLIFGFVVVYAAVKLFAPMYWQQAFLSPFGDRFTTDGYYLLSSNHIFDFINLLLLLVPVALIIFILLAAGIRIEKGTNHASIILFLTTGVIAGLLTAFTLEPELGMARDWDLLSTLLIGVQIAGVFIWVYGYQNRRHFQAATVMIIILCLSIFVPWIAMLNSIKSSYFYSLAVMELDPKHSRTGMFTMIPLNQKQGNTQESQRLIKYCAINYPEIDLHKQGERELLNGNYRQAEIFIDRAIAANPGFSRSYETRARIQNEMGRYDEALENLKIADGLNPYSSTTNYYMGLTYEKMRELDKAVKSWRLAVHYDASDPMPYIELADYFYKSGMVDSAGYYYRLIPDTAALSPSYNYYRFGVDGLKYGDTARAKIFLERYLEKGDDSNLISNVNRIMNSLPSETD